MTARFENSKPLLYTAEEPPLMIRKFYNEMELNSKYRPIFYPWKYNSNDFTTFTNKSAWTENVITAEDRGGNMTVPNVTRFDLNNNDDVDLYPITQRKIKNAMQRKFLLQSKNQTCFKDNGSDDNYIDIYPSDSSWPNSVLVEQTEPIDLSCMKKTNSNTENKAVVETKTIDYFERNPEDTSLPSLQPSTKTTESSILILKSVYDIKYNRRPNCDQIFDEDPTDSKLFVCRVCDKRVRSKWHHFQTHYSRDHKCTACDAVYSRIDTLRSHAKKRHQTIIPRYYYGIPANVWHRVIGHCRDPPVPKPPKPPAPALRPPACCC